MQQTKLQQLTCSSRIASDVANQALGVSVDLNETRSSVKISHNQQSSRRQRNENGICVSSGQKDGLSAERSRVEFSVEIASEKKHDQRRLMTDR